MRAIVLGLGISTLVTGLAPVGQAQQLSSNDGVRQFVQRAVDNELAKDRDDHTRWLYFETDQKPEHPVKQWVAETAKGSLKRVLQLDGRVLSEEEQKQRMDAYLNDPAALAKAHKSGSHDDAEAAKMLQMLPKAFLWTKTGERDGCTILHFRPDPNFSPSDMEAKVFAAMEGEMLVHTQQLRIASLKGHLTQDVKFLGGLLGQLEAGGSFDVERRETGRKGVWQITESHIHIKGHALLFKNIGEQEDDVKTDFRELPQDTTMEQARQELLEVRPGSERTQARR